MSSREESKKFLKKRFPWTGRSNKKKDEPPADNLNTACSRGDHEDSAISKPTSKKPFDPWWEGQQLLRKDETLNKIWEGSIHILKSRLGLKYEDNGNASSVNDLYTFLDVITQRLEDKKWTILDDIGQSDTQKKLTKVCRNILLVKDVVNPAVATSPPAAIACAGITVGLLLFIQAVEQHETLLQGLDIISSLIPRLHVIEHHFLRRDADLTTDLRRTLERDMTQICSKVLEFQSRAICYLGKWTAGQFFTDMLKKDGWDGILQDIERYDTSLKNTTSSAHVLEIDRKFEALQDRLQQMQVWQTKSAKDQKKANLFQRLYTCPYKDRKDRNSKRVPGTCEWFTNHPQFTKWNQSRTSELLWVSADPGCGKSVLTRYLADECLPSGVRTVCYFFFKDDFADQKQATNALSSVLRQLLIAQPHLVHDSLLDKSETSGKQLVESFNELWNILLHVTADENAGEVICLFDALDECQEDDRRKLIQAVENLFLNNIGKRKLKFLMTSRPYDHIRRDFFKLEKSLPTIRLSGENEENIEKISSEIDLVIAARVRDIGERNLLQQEECDFIIEQLTSVSNRTYLWVSLTLDVVERMPGFSRGSVRRVVHEIPLSVDAAYTRILDRSPDHARARKLLHIVTAAERPLTLEEISLSLAVNAEDQSTNDIQNEIQTSERTQIMIRDLCGLFLVVVDGKVYLLHQTAKEFLVKDPARGDTGPSTWKHSLHPRESHYILAGICTLYLTEVATYNTFPSFMDYAANNWAVHFRRASVSSKDPTTKRGRTLCQPDSKVFKDWAATYKRSIDKRKRRGFPYPDDILMASYLGLTAVVNLLLEAKNVDVESKSLYGRTPLSFAAENGHGGVVKLLLETGKVDVESKDSQYGQTPLSFAAENGNEEVVKLLLEAKNVDVESKSLNDRTPLSFAAENGHEQVVKLLLETGKVDVESKDSRYGQTPLSFAAENGNEEVVKLLLETGQVDVESKDSANRTPLSFAAGNGYEAVVRALLETGKVDVESKDCNNRTPLSLAAGKGHVEVVKVLLETGKVDVESKDSNNRTPLTWAAGNGHEGVLKLLLETGKVDVESKSQFGETPLSWAAENGYEEVVKLLLETGQVDVESKDSADRTPLSWAAGKGHVEVVKVLLETGKVDVDSKDCNNRTPLSLAAVNGHDGVVKLLLETGKVDMGSRDYNGHTPLFRAAQNGHEGVVRLLQEASLERKISRRHSQHSVAVEADRL